MAKPDSNGLYNPRHHPDGLEAYTSNPPTTAAEAIKRGYNTFIDEYGIEQKMRYKARAKERNGAKYEIEVLANRDANRGSDARRAATNEQTLTRQDYRDYAARNGYSQERADQLYDQNQERLKQVRQIVTQSRGGKNYEHLLPTRSPMRGGVEHWRNIIPMDTELNSAKSDKLATIEGARQAQVPLTKSSALQMDFGDRPGLNWDTQQKIILGDIESQGDDVKTTREVRQNLSKNPDVVSQGQRFGLRAARGGLRLLIPSAVAGGASLALGAGDLQAREELVEQDPSFINQLQLNLARAEMSSDAVGMVPSPASPLAELVGFASGATNFVIDSGRAGLNFLTDVKQPTEEELDFSTL